MIKLNDTVKLTKALKAKDSGVLYSLPQGLIGKVKEVITSKMNIAYLVEFDSIEASFILTTDDIEAYVEE